MNIVQRLEDLIRPRAAEFDVKNLHWIHGYDESLSYCRECAEKEVAKLLKEEPDEDYFVDGGWGSEVESYPTCEECYCVLDGSFLDSLCSEELYYLEQDFDINNPENCHILWQILLNNTDSLAKRLEFFAYKTVYPRLPRKLKKRLKIKLNV
jgi:hypothetical protein